MNMNHLTVETEDSFTSLLELAANNDIIGFKRFVERDPAAIDDVGLWYGRSPTKQMVLEHRTPLMVASTYGSIDIIKLIVSLSQSDVNRSCGADQTTALHCAVSGGSSNVVDAVKILLSAGADPNSVDSSGRRPVESIDISPDSQSVKPVIEALLKINGPDVLFSSPRRKEYPIDPSLPDIKNIVYSTDEFRMFSFKVRHCSRAYSHDWTECPFVHPGENARRRDPRKFHYSCVPCPDFRKGACRRGDMCEYAHGVFECWLHPAQYRTRLCKDGTACNRRVCFFAHTHEELRPLYVSTGSAVPSPRSTTTPTSDFPFLSSPFPRLRLSDFDVGIGHCNSPMNNHNPHSTLPKTLNLSNVKDLFTLESLSPRYADQSLIFSPTQKSSILNQTMLSPLSASRVVPNQQFTGFSPESWSDWTHNLHTRRHLQQQQQQQHRSLNCEEIEEPDLSWVQSLVKEPSQEVVKDDQPPPMAGSTIDEIEQGDPTALGAWLEQMKLDQLTAQ